MKYKVNFKTKANDMDDKERARLAEEFLLIEGYTMIKSGLATLKYQRDEYDVADGYVIGKTTCFVWLTSNEVSKIYQDRTGFESYDDLSNAELKFFDNLGFEIERGAASKTGQSIDDWFWKAADSLTQEDIEKKVDEFLTAKGYKGQPAEDSDSSSNVIFIKTVTPDMYVKINIVNRLNNAQREVYKRGYTTEKDGHIGCEMLKLTDDELKFFDDIGYDLGIGQKSETKQSIDDWFWSRKASDSLSNDEILERVTRFMVSEGYKLTRNNVPTTRVYAKRTNDDPDTLERVYVGMRDEGDAFTGFINKVEAVNVNGVFESDHIKFTNRELKFFDDLGFKLNYVHKLATKENMDDWFWNKKADDGITAEEAIKSWIRKNGYRIAGEDPDGLIVETKTYVDATTHPRRKTRHVQSFLIDITRRLVTRTEMVEYEDGSNTEHAIIIDKEDLKFFDNLGFTIDEHAAEITEQTIDDWFWEGKAHDAVSRIVTLASRLRGLGYGMSHTVDNDIKFQKPQERDEDVRIILYAGEYWKKSNSDNYMKLEKARSHYVIKFTNEELKIIDDLDFELVNYYSVDEGQVRQDVDDWFHKKGLDDAVDRFDRLISGLKAFGYNTPTESEGHLQFDKFILPAIDAGGKKLLTRINLYSGSYWRQTQDPNYMKLGKSTNYYKDHFTKDELKLLDDLGFELTSDYDGIQNVNDWFDMEDEKDATIR